MILQKVTKEAKSRICKWQLVICYLLLAGLVCGCPTTKPGQATVVSSGGRKAELRQHANSKEPSEQTVTVKRDVERAPVIVLPMANGKWQMANGTNGNYGNDGRFAELIAALANAQPAREHVEEITTTKLGASYEDRSLEIGKKLKAMYPLMLVALACFVFAGVMVYFQHYHLAIISGAGGIVGLILFKVFTEITATGALLLLGGVALMALLAWSIHNHTLSDFLQKAAKETKP